MIVKERGNNTYKIITLVLGLFILVILVTSKINRKHTADRIIDQVDRIQEESKKLYTQQWNNKTLSEYTKKSFINKYAFAIMGKRNTSDAPYEFEEIEEKSIVLRYNYDDKSITLEDEGPDIVIRVDNFKRMGTGSPKYEYMADGYLNNMLVFKVVVAEDYLLLIGDTVIIMCTVKEDRLLRLTKFADKFIESKNK